MRKLTLALDDLAVDSFSTGDGGVHAGQCRHTLLNSTCQPGTGGGLCLPETGTEDPSGGTCWTEGGETCAATCNMTCETCAGHATCANGMDTCSFTCYYGTCAYDC